MDRNNIGSGKLDTGPKCTECGVKLDGFTGPENERPSDGDLTICGYCANIGMYAQGLTVIRTLTLEELKELRDNHPNEWKQLSRARTMVVKMLARKNPSPDITNDDGISFQF